MPPFPFFRTVLVATLLSLPALAAEGAQDKEADEDPAVLADQEEPTVMPEGNAAQKPATVPKAEGSHKAKEVKAAKVKPHKTRKAKAKTASKTKPKKVAAHKAKDKATANDKVKVKAKTKKPVAEKAKAKKRKALEVKHVKPAKSAKHAKPATVHASHKAAQKPLDIVQ